MKKNLMLISFAFIFLLSLSIVSANFFDWLNGDATSLKTAAGEKLPTSTAKTSGTDRTTSTTRAPSTFDRTLRTSSGTSSVKENQNLVCPRGNVWFKTKDVNGNDCCQRKAENKGREGSTRFPWGYKVNK